MRYSQATSRENIINEHNKMSEEILVENPDLIVWPETVIPKLYEIKVQNYSKIKKFSGAPLLTGIHTFTRTEDTKVDKLYNSMVLISDNKKKIDQYSKIKLLPFVERFPLPFMNIFLNILGYHEFTPGKR